MVLALFQRFWPDVDAFPYPVVVRPAPHLPLVPGLRIWCYGYVGFVDSPRFTLIPVYSLAVIWLRCCGRWIMQPAMVTVDVAAVIYVTRCDCAGYATVLFLIPTLLLIYPFPVEPSRVGTPDLFVTPAVVG